VAEIHAHEFMGLDGVIDAPTWTAEMPSPALVVGDQDRYSQ
jgi:hypothetical protein